MIGFRLVLPPFFGAGRLRFFMVVSPAWDRNAFGGPGADPKFLPRGEGAALLTPPPAGRGGERPRREPAAGIIESFHEIQLRCDRSRRRGSVGATVRLIWIELIPKTPARFDGPSSFPELPTTRRKLDPVNMAWQWLLLEIPRYRSG
jgi:hypothetical protein